MRKPYNADFYDDQWHGSRRSAEHIVPQILALTNADSVVDVGCGIGTWLSVYKDLRVGDLLGMDGHWVKPDRLLVPRDRFRAVDLAAPPSVGRRFALAQSLEVAEHLDDSAAAGFVGLLASLSDVVVFSAAVPYQGGTHHVNERWAGYWKALFEERGYILHDVFRPRLWDRDDVDWWYAQNMFLYLRAGARPALEETLRPHRGFVFPEKIVHPFRIDPRRNAPPGIKYLARSLVKAVKPRVRRALGLRRPARAASVSR